MKDPVRIFFFGLILGCALGAAVWNIFDEQAAIRVGVGYHNPISGNFEWRTNEVPVHLTK